MADAKISALTNLTAADAINDMIPIVDVSDTPPASGNTKRISINNLLSSSPTASGALTVTGLVTAGSAAITGDLTVDTSTLKVDSTNNRVGIGTASPSYDLEVAGSVRSNIAIRGNFAGGTDIAHLRFVNANGSIVSDIFSQNTNGGASDTAYLSFQTASSGTLAERYRIDGTGISTWSVGGTTAMTLNSTGLGIGTGPSYKLHVRDSASTVAMFHSTNASGPYVIFQNSTGNFGDIGSELAITGGGSAGNLTLNSRSTSNLCLSVNDTVRMRIDSSGNVGVGVTPITSHILSAAGPLGISGTTAGSRTSYITNSSAASIYYTDGGGSGYFTDFGNLIIQPRTSAARSVVIATGSTTPVERAVVKSTGQVRFVPLASDPAGAEAGDVYYNSTSNKLKCYNGTTWNDLF
jgi:hypothetical protein